MAELVDARDLGSRGEIRGGSSPLPPMKSKVFNGSVIILPNGMRHILLYSGDIY